MLDRKLLLASLIMSMLLPFLAICFLGSTTFNFADFSIQAGVTLSSPGTTNVQFGPLGEVKTHTHTGPVGLFIDVRNVDFNLISRLCEKPHERTRVIEEALVEGRKAIGIFVLKCIAFGFAGGAIAPLIFGLYDLKSLMRGSTLGICCLAFLTAFTIRTYNTRPFEDWLNGRASAPSMTGVVEISAYKVGEMGERLAVVSKNLLQLFQKVELLQPLAMPDSDLQILHVSDIHNNPIAFDLLKQAIRIFKVDTVIDSGDITDWGSSLEGQQLRKLTALNVPYIFVPGNHDSPAVIGVIEQSPKAHVLENTTYNIENLTIAGITSDSNKVKKRILDKKPSILIVHDKEHADDLIGSVSLVLHGHNHRVSLKEKSSTVIIGAGTLGGAGLRGLEKSSGITYTMVLLHIKKGHKPGDLPTLVAVDTIKIVAINTGFTIERKVIMKELGSPIQLPRRLLHRR